MLFWMYLQIKMIKITKYIYVMRKHFINMVIYKKNKK